MDISKSCYDHMTEEASMKGRLLIVFKSVHGYVKRYVDILGNALGCDAVPSDKLRGDMLANYDKILFISSVRGGQLNGYKRVGEFVDAVYKKFIVCGVGLLPYSKRIAERIREANISVSFEKFVPVFYAQGGFDIKELSRTENLALRMMVNRIKSSNIISEEETQFLKAVHTPLDEIKQANIQPLIDYLEDKEVDPELYAPPEITDEEQEKQFFKEQEQAAQVPENKKRALKKKLKK